MVARPWSSSRLSCGERLLLRCDGNAGNSFPTTQGKDPSSRAVAAVSRTLRMDQGICGFPSRLSHEAFPRGFPTGLFHVPLWCESILGLKVEAVQRKQVSLEWTETSGELWECGTTLEFLSPFLRRAPPLEIRWELRELFPDHSGKRYLLSS